MNADHNSILRWRGDAPFVRSIMAGIGIVPGDDEPWLHVNIEDALLLGSLEAIRTGSEEFAHLLNVWFSVHHQRVIASRLCDIVVREQEQALFNLWGDLATLGHTRSGNRFDRLLAPDCPAPRVLRVPQSLDVFSPRELAQHHRGYFYRVIVGATARADALAALDVTGDLTPTEIARLVHCSVSTAWQARRDFELTIYQR